MSTSATFDLIGAITSATTSIPTLSSSDLATVLNGASSIATSASSQAAAASDTTAAPELSKESLSRLAQSLPKYLIGGGVVVGVLILLGALSWWWKRRKRRASFGFGDEEWHAVAPGPGSRRASDSSEKRTLEQVRVESTGPENTRGVYGTDSEGDKLLSPLERIGEPRLTGEQ